jgi:hypothetical protein
MIDKKNKINNRTTKKQIIDMDNLYKHDLKNCSKKLRDDEDVVLKFITYYWGHMNDASDRLKNDGEFVRRAIEKKLACFMFASDQFTKNKNFILELVKLYGVSAIEYCDPITRHEIYKKLKTPAIQVLEGMIEEENND